MHHFYNAVVCFNQQRFYDCHEVLEDECWRPETNPANRQWLQGLLQIAVGYHHAQQGNAKGARNLLKRGLSNIHESMALGVDKSLISTIDGDTLLAAVTTHIPIAENWVTAGNNCLWEDLTNAPWPTITWLGE